METPVRNRVNGLDLDQLGQIVQAVQQDPKQAAVAFRATTTWQGGARSSARIRSWSIGGVEKPRNFTIDADEPTELLGKASAPNPQELFLSAVNACMMVGYVALASLKGVTLERLEIESSGDLDLRGFLGLDPTVPVGYPEVRVRVRIAGDGTKEVFEEIHQGVMATSPNVWNVVRPVTLVPELQVG